jgi:hypothetical protein
MDRKIERQKERAAKESAPRPATPAEQATLDAIKVLRLSSSRNIISLVSCKHIPHKRHERRGQHFS